ncbi:MAG: GGDEF domain-containing protein [Halanaerobiaceae bacterium]
MKNNLLADCSYPFDQYLDKLGKFLIIIFDENYKILETNKRFKEIFDIEKDIKKLINLKDIVLKSNWNKIKLPEKASFINLQLEFANKYFPQDIYNIYECYIFKRKNDYCLIGQENVPGRDEIIKKISLLNNELSSKTRKLTKKNINLKNANNKIENLLKTDELTGLSNRRYFMDYFKNMLSQSKQEKFYLCIVMGDLDKFKNINDTYGHNAGDEVLSLVGELLSQETRKQDLAARIGGEEFAVLLLETRLPEAEEYAERIRNLISQLEFDNIPEKITISLGLTERKEDDTVKSFLVRADEALYQAKNTGRNKVIKI